MEKQGFKDFNTGQSEYNAMTFLVQQMLNKIQTVTLVKIIAVTNAGELSPVGFVDVQPLVNQMTADRIGIEHGVIYGLPYFRLQGGADAIIIDPKVGDIGMCCFASRDITAVISTKKQANQGSYRIFDWADGLYIGGMLNGTPSQYVRFSAEGIEITSPASVTINAPDVTLNATEIQLNGSAKVIVTAPEIELNGKITQTSGTFSIGGITFGDHVHNDTHGGDTGVPHN